MQKASAAMLGALVVDSSPSRSTGPNPIRSRCNHAEGTNFVGPHTRCSATFLTGFGSTNGPAMLSLNLRGFSPGHYLVGIVRASDQTFVPLAKVVIMDPTAEPDRDATM